MPATQAVDLARLRSLTTSGRAQAIREESRLSRAEVASQLGVHETTVARWEAADRSPKGDAAARYYALLQALTEEVL